MRPKKTNLAKLPAKSSALIAGSPSPALAKTNLQRLIDVSDSTSLSKIPSGDHPKLFFLLGSSAFLSDVLIRDGGSWPILFLRQIATPMKTAADHLRELEPAIKKTASFADFCAALRRHKQREYLRIGSRDLMPSVTMEETVRELTALAHALEVLLDVHDRDVGGVAAAARILDLARE